MPNTPATCLQDDLAEANWHRHRGDHYMCMAGTSSRRDYWLNRALISYALANVIIVSMKDEGDG